MQAVRFGLLRSGFPRGERRGALLLARLPQRGQGDSKTEHTQDVWRRVPLVPVPLGVRRLPDHHCSLPCRDADPERRAMLLEMNTRQQLGRTTRAERLGYALLDSLGVEYLRQSVFGGKFTPTR